MCRTSSATVNSVQALTLAITKQVLTGPNNEAKHLVIKSKTDKWVLYLFRVFSSSCQEGSPSGMARPTAGENKAGF